MNKLFIKNRVYKYRVIWESWRAEVHPARRTFCDLLVKATLWNVWLARNESIFNAKVVPVHVIIMNIDRMLLSWFSICADNVKAKLEEPMHTIRRSLEFLSVRSEGDTGISAEEAPVASTE